MDLRGPRCSHGAECWTWKSGDSSVWSRSLEPWVRSIGPSLFFRLVITNGRSPRILLASLGPTWAFFLNGVSFAFVLVALLLVRNRQVALETALSGALKGAGRPPFQPSAGSQTSTLMSESLVGASVA